MTIIHNPVRMSSRIASAIQRDTERQQMRLPFPDENTIDMVRCCAIMHVSPWVVRRLMVSPLKVISGRSADDGMCLFGYTTMRGAPIRIEYDSVVRFLDVLREKHGIPDRRIAPIFRRRRDDELLPFPWSDTMTVIEAADTLNVVAWSVLKRIDAGLFEAYQMVPSSPWRISRSSFEKYLGKIAQIPRRERPYGG